MKLGDIIQYRGKCGQVMGSVPLQKGQTRKQIHVLFASGLTVIDAAEAKRIDHRTLTEVNAPADRPAKVGERGEI